MYQEAGLMALLASEKDMDHHYQIRSGDGDIEYDPFIIGQIPALSTQLGGTLSWQDWGSAESLT